MPNVEDSIVMRACTRAVDAVEAAWSHSVARRLWTGAWPTSTRQAQQRHVGVVMITASLTAMLLQPLATYPVPFMWLVPSLALVFGLMCVVRSR